jgi:hypothetical protein
MSNKSSVGGQSSSAVVAELLDQRVRIQSWLDNLETVGAEANTRVVERVRADYSERLRGVIEQLTGHLASIRADRESRESELTSATQRHRKATDQLEEARLRHMIGELSDEEWRERQPELAEAVEEAEADREDARAEVARLDDLLRQIEDEGPDEEEDAGAPAVTDAPSDEPVVQDAGETTEAGTPEPTPGEEEVAEAMSDLDDAGTIDGLPELRPYEAFSARNDVDDGDPDLRIVHSPDPLAFLSELPGSEDATVEQPAAEAGELGFLRDLDRAIAGDDGEGGDDEGGDDEAGGAAAGADTGASSPADEDPEQFRPTPGTKCPECGYTNDPEAWYCGVCGVDLA